jgi:hypothetical protein
MTTSQITVLLYHGKEDPKWELNEQFNGQIKHHLNKIRFTTTKSEINCMTPPPYGFRGFLLNTNNKIYKIYKNNIECVTDNTFAIDSSRTLETILINSSPTKIRSHLTSF